MFDRKSVLDQLFEFSISIMRNANVIDSRKRLALEVILTLAEKASDMVKEKAAKYIPLIGK